MRLASCGFLLFPPVIHRFGEFCQRNGFISEAANRPVVAMASVGRAEIQRTVSLPFAGKKPFWESFHPALRKYDEHHYTGQTNHFGRDVTYIPTHVQRHTTTRAATFLISGLQPDATSRLVCDQCNIPHSHSGLGRGKCFALTIRLWSTETNGVSSIRTPVASARNTGRFVRARKTGMQGTADGIVALTTIAPHWLTQAHTLSPLC